MERKLYDIQCTNRVDTVNIACIQGRYKEETWEKILILSKDSCMKFLCAYFKAPFIPSTKNFWKIKNTTRDVLSQYFYRKTKRNPMIIPVIMNKK